MCSLLILISSSDAFSQVSAAKVNIWPATKASLIIKYLNYVVWPTSVLPSKKEPLTICLFRGDPLEEYIPKAASKEHSPYTLTVKKVGYKDSFYGCHILFVSEGNNDHIDEVIASTKGKPILTMSDIRGFAKNGGIAGFFIRSNGHKETVLEINISSLQSSGIHIDTDFISIMDIYR
ncbi:MAG: YfiR family protein [Alphaproteobacteria bacterium]|nr:YfiR family protein [Alphaproteobacteria bacterium]